MPDGIDIHNEYGQIKDKNLAEEMAYAIKPLEDEAAAKGVAMERSAEKKLTPEQEQWRAYMEKHIEQRPHVWETQYTPDGTKILICKISKEVFPNAYSHISPIITDDGIVEITSEASYNKQEIHESWADTDPECLATIADVSKNRSSNTTFREKQVEASRIYVHYLPLDQAQNRLIEMRSLMDSSELRFKNLAEHPVIPTTPANLPVV